MKIQYFKKEWIVLHECGYYVYLKQYILLITSRFEMNACVVSSKKIIILALLFSLIILILFFLNF